MTYKRHWLLSWGGTLADGADIWANNIRMMNDNTGESDDIDDGQMNELLDDFVSDIRTLFANPNAKIPGAVQCQWVKFNEIGPDGRYVNTSTTFARFLAGTTGQFALINGTGSTLVPPFQSVAVTMTTARQRGPGSKGRLFIPQCSATCGPSGRIDGTQTQNMATAYASFLSALGDEAGIDETAIAPAVVSNVGEPGPVERITGVRVGDVHDVIRRRKSALVEKYATATVATD